MSKGRENQMMLFNQVVERDTMRMHCNSILLTIERPDSGSDPHSMKVVLIEDMMARLQLILLK